MSLYYFNLLILGNPKITKSYITLALNDAGKEKETSIEWYKEIKVFENKCELDLNLIIDYISYDLDGSIQMADGIMYFLNPMDEEEEEFFDIVLPIIQSSKRGIPVVIIYYDPSGLIPISVNELLERLWVNQPDLEGFVNLSPRKFHQALQCISEAMITGDTPLNIENAWMRYPIFIQLANIYYKNGLYEKAARAVRKAAMIAEIFEKQNQFIIAEQSAFLFAEVDLFLEASKIMEDIDRKKSRNYKKLYATSLLEEGNKLFNQKKYKEAARKYLETAHWSAIELKDRKITEDAFKTAVNAWISACKVENAFQILDNLDHNISMTILKEFAQKIEQSIAHLDKQEDYQYARDQLYKTISVYQREGLFDILENFTNQLQDILIKILNYQIDSGKKHSAKQTYDEIENLWKSYGVKKLNLDSQLEDLIILFVDELDFGMTSLLMNKVESKSIKKKLTEVISNAEDKYKESKKRDLERNLQNGLEVVQKFINFENKLVKELSKKVISEANIIKEKEGFKKAAFSIKEQAEYYEKIGKEDAKDKLLVEALKILLMGNIMKSFFDFFDFLSNQAQKDFLRKIFGIVQNKLEEIQTLLEFEQCESVYSKFLTRYREKMLYEEAVMISEKFIEFLKYRALEVIKKQQDKKGVNEVRKLLKKIEIQSAKYLDEKKFDLDDILSKVVSVSLSESDFVTAREFCDKIKNPMLKSDLNKKIDKRESEISQIELTELKKERDKEELKHRVLIIRTKASEAEQEKVNLLRQRNALKRIYFQNVLNALQENDLERVVNEYKKIVEILVEKERYNIAGTSLVMIILVNLSQDIIKPTVKFVEKIKEKLLRFQKLIAELFPFSLSDYLIDVKRILGEQEYLEALEYAKSLPLFDEEKAFLYKYYGSRFKLVEDKKDFETKLDHKELRETLESYGQKMQIDKQEINKRKLMKQQYWKLALEDLKKSRFSLASKEYYEVSIKLAEKKFVKQSILSIIIGSFIELKSKIPEEVKLISSKILKRLTNYDIDPDNYPEIKFLDLFMDAIDAQDLKSIQYGIDLLKEKFFFFEPEIKLIESFLPKDYKKAQKIEEESLSRKQIGKIKQRNIRLDQEFASLQQKTSDIRTDRSRLINKRNAMRRRYYKETISLIESEKYSDLTKNYQDLAKKSADRRDYESCALHLLLYGLASLKAKIPLKEIKNSINGVLKSLGLNRKLVEDTFAVKGILLIIDLKINHIYTYNTRLSEMLDMLPLFEEEKFLLSLESSE